EWVSARADAPVYKKLGHDLYLSALAAAPLNPWPAISCAYEVQHSYAEASKSSFFTLSRYKMPGLDDPNFALSFYPSLNTPENATATFGAYLSGSPLVAATTYQAGAYAKDSKEMAGALAAEVRKRANLGTSLLLTGTGLWSFVPAALDWTTKAKENQ